MDTFPLTVLDGFFSDPDKVLEYAKTLEYRGDPEGSWPGLRTRPLNEFNFELHSNVCHKMLFPFYGNAYDIPIRAEGTFQKIPAGEYTSGQIHRDVPALAPGIVYLSPSGSMDTGTSLYSIKRDVVGLNVDLRTKYFDKDESKKEAWNSQFEETVKVGGFYNRLFLFDSSQYHRANEYNHNNGEDRYTLTYFFFDIQESMYPVTRSRRVLI